MSKAVPPSEVDWGSDLVFRGLASVVFFRMAAVTLKLLPLSGKKCHYFRMSMCTSSILHTPCVWMQ